MKVKVWELEAMVMPGLVTKVMVPETPFKEVVTLKRLRLEMAPVRPFREVVVLKLGARFEKVKVCPDEAIWMPVEVAKTMVPVTPLIVVVTPKTLRLVREPVRLLIEVVVLKRLRLEMAPVRPFREVVVLKLGARLVKVKVFEEEVIWMPVEVASPMVPVYELMEVVVLKRFKLLMAPVKPFKEVVVL